MSALSIRHMGFTMQEREHAYHRAWLRYKNQNAETLLDDLLLSRDTFYGLMYSEMSWARKGGKLACRYCQNAFDAWRKVRDLEEQIRLYATIIQPGLCEPLEFRRSLSSSPAA